MAQSHQNWYPIHSWHLHVHSQHIWRVYQGAEKWDPGTFILLPFYLVLCLTFSLVHSYWTGLNNNGHLVCWTDKSKLHWNHSPLDTHQWNTWDTCKVDSLVKSHCVLWSLRSLHQKKSHALLYQVVWAGWDSVLNVFKGASHHLYLQFCSLTLF